MAEQIWPPRSKYRHFRVAPYLKFVSIWWTIIVVSFILVLNFARFGVFLAHIAWTIRDFIQNTVGRVANGKGYIGYKMTVFCILCNLTCQTPYSKHSYSHHGDVHNMLQCSAIITQPIASKLLTKGKVSVVGSNLDSYFSTVTEVMFYRVILDRVGKWHRYE